MLLEIAEREMAPDITVVELAGKLELGRESQRIETLVDDLVKRGSTRVIFDMRGVEHMDSTGLGMLALASGKLREVGRKPGDCGAGGAGSGDVEPDADQYDCEGVSHGGSRRGGAVNGERIAPGA